MGAPAMIAQPLTIAAVMRRAAIFYVAWTVALVALAVVLWLAGGGEAVRQRTGDPGLHAGAEGLGTVLRILSRNLPIAAVAIVAAHEVPRRPEWRAAVDFFTLAIASLSMIVGAACLAAFGWELVVYAIAFGPVEIAGFAVAIATYWAARRRPPLTTSGLAPATASAVGLLILAAVLEARLGGAL